MYFEFESLDQDPVFSWAISKNPTGAPYVRSLSASKDENRIVEGKFIDKFKYQVIVKNDGLAFLRKMQEENRDAYVTAEKYIVCPYNLQGFVETFRSALRGLNETKGAFSDEDFFGAKKLKAEIGPFPLGNFGIFENADITVEIKEENTVEVKTLILTSDKLSISEFLRRIYIISTALTMKYNWQIIDVLKIEKYVNIGGQWLKNSPDRNYIINKLSGSKPSLKEKLSEGLAKISSSESDDDGRSSDKERKIGLHERRHNLIVKIISNEISSIEERTISIVDLGSSEGKLLEKIINIDNGIMLRAIEAQKFKTFKLKKMKHERLQIIHDNIIYPSNVYDLLNPDFIVASEVIEHLVQPDRDQFIKLIRDVIKPEVLIITTPNIAYNKIININEGEFRHPDHKIEYDLESLTKEVLVPLSKKYEVNLLPLIQDISENNDEVIQPSFIIVAKLKPTKEEHNNVPWFIKRFHESSYIPEIDLHINPESYKNGYTNDAFLQNSHSIFWLGPTIPPVDFNENVPDFLEHPTSAFNYFSRKGQKIIIEEPKHMGSRAYIAIFRDKKIAKEMHFENDVIINTRNGFQFFDSNHEIYDRLRLIQEKMGSDFLFLDCEILPWSLTGKKLISRKFKLPGEAALLFRSKFDSDLLENATLFSKQLELYSQETSIQIRPFHLLAYGNVGKNKEHKIYSRMTHNEQLSLLDFLETHCDIIKTTRYDFVDLDNDSSKINSITRWLDFTNQGGEGFVYKTYNHMEFGMDNYLIQPMVKVRGKDYLRIIYGMDYLMEDYAKRLRKNRNRNTLNKRMLAIKENYLAHQIMMATLNCNKIERMKAIAAFLGHESSLFIDKTL